MNIKSVYRVLLLFIGVCTVAVILLSKAIYPVNEKSDDQDKSSKTEVVIHAPADVASQGSSVTLTNSLPSVIATLSQDGTQRKKFTIIKKIYTAFYKTLFRVIISPNAP